jgi:hypothetical protein
MMVSCPAAVSMAVLPCRAGDAPRIGRVKWQRSLVSADTSAIVIAAVGVFGTLVAPIVSQALSTRARREDFEMQKSQRDEDYAHQQRNAELGNKRSCYIGVTAASRRYRVELMNYLYSVKRGTVDDAARTELEDARRAFTASLAEAQMVATLKVLSTIDPVNSGLSRGYGMTKGLESGDQEENGSFEEIVKFLDELWELWRGMREAMRCDLGIED